MQKKIWIQLARFGCCFPATAFASSADHIVRPTSIESYEIRFQYEDSLSVNIPGLEPCTQNDYYILNINGISKTASCKNTGADSGVERVLYQVSNPTTLQSLVNISGDTNWLIDFLSGGDIVLDPNESGTSDDYPLIFQLKTPFKSAFLTGTRYHPNLPKSIGLLLEAVEKTLQTGKSGRP